MRVCVCTWVNDARVCTLLQAQTVQSSARTPSKSTPTHLHTSVYTSILHMWECASLSTHRLQLKPAVFSACGWTLAEGKVAPEMTACLCYSAVCLVALRPASALFSRQLERVWIHVLRVCLCVRSECAGLDLHTLLLIKRTQRQSGVSAAPGGIEASRGRGAV